jgi:hypothetical protein
VEAPPPPHPPPPLMPSSAAIYRLSSEALASRGPGLSPPGPAYLQRALDVAGLVLVRLVHQGERPGRAAQRLCQLRAGRLCQLRAGRLCQFRLHQGKRPGRAAQRLCSLSCAAPSQPARVRVGGWVRVARPAHPRLALDPQHQTWRSYGREREMRERACLAPQHAPRLHVQQSRPLCAGSSTRA